jgi:Icc-related predicted phosphoesterase
MQGLIELPRRGKAVVVTDMHGSLRLFKAIMEKAQLIKNLSRGTYFICAGDFIHAAGEKDYSIELIEQLQFLKERFSSRVFVLLGNHEWSHISNVPIYKAGQNQYDTFLKLLKERFGTKAEMKLKEYVSFFRSLPIAAKAGSILVSHAAPDMSITDTHQFNDFDAGKIKSESDKFYNMLWARPKSLGFEEGSYEDADIELFLGRLGMRLSIVGHTEVDGFYSIGQQMIVNSLSGNYLELDLEKNYKSVKDLEEAKRGIGKK